MAPRATSRSIGPEPPRKRPVEPAARVFPPPPPGDPAIPARPLVRQLKRIAGWTLAWTLFQWWAVIGWPEGTGGVYAGAMFAWFIAVVTGSLWRDIRAEARADLPASVIPLRPRPASHSIPGRPSESKAGEDLAA
jgi:hypothetical protein